MQRACACGQHTAAGGECEECKKKREGTLQRAAIDRDQVREVPPVVHEVLQSPGQPLDAATRAFMEPRFGQDFSSVRVHTSGQAAESAQAVNALAYTVGQNVVFGTGQYAPHTESGSRLIAHELTHVVQQGEHLAGPPQALALFSQTHDTSEQEARTAADQMLAGLDVRVQQQPSAQIQGDAALGAGIGAASGAAVGGIIGALAGGPIGALIGLGAGALLGALIGGLAARDPKVSRECAQLFDKIRQHAVYQALSSGARKLADEIISLAQKRSNCLYYAAKLKLLFDTPEAAKAQSGQPPPQGSTLERNRKRVNEAAEAERDWLATPEAHQQRGRQEQVADDPSRVWTQRQGKNGKIFYVDRRDPAHIVVRIKVRLLAGGVVTTSEDIANEIQLEDAIERVAETRGYTIDVIFIDSDGPDVFTFNVDFDKWPTAANPVGNHRTLAHEIHHLMGLDDRYDYIESHAANRNMDIPTRLHWFRQQMNREPDPGKETSLMGRGSTMLDDDVCRVAGLDVQSCVAARKRAATPSAN